MRTQKSTLRQVIGKLLWLISFLISCPLLSVAQSETTSAETQEPSDLRPTQSDTASLQLIKNYLTVTGGQEAHQAVSNVLAEGTIKESTLQRNFSLIETADGKRHLTYYWTHLGRKHRVLYVYDGLQAWMQVLEPKKQEAKLYGGADGIHFTNQHWLLQPFTLPMLADYVFNYQGSSKVSGRPAHIIKGYGKKGTHSWFYFDKEKFLLTRWGGEGQIAGMLEQMDYRATQFKSVDGVLLPSKIDLLVENAAFGHIQFKQIKLNQNLNELSFLMPRSSIPTLRQRPTVEN
ncbi:hypothetical protein ACWPKO_13645 [Coraliomargarita sp. W4R53]